jgi:DNA repair protein RadC
MAASKSKAENNNIQDKNTSSKSKTTDKKENVHAGHRARMRKRFIETGLKGFDEYQMLEMLLFFSCPRIDTNVMAHNLINKMGSLDNVLDSTVEDLMEVGGTNESTAVLLRMIPLIMENYHVNKARTCFKNDKSKLSEYIQSLFYSAVTEKIFILSMDNGFSVISEDMIGQGSAGAVHCDIRKIVEIAVRNNASGIILAHNHPSGSIKPSDEDIEVTKNIARTLESIQVTFIDHYIVSDSRVLSMYSHGYDDLFTR